MMAPTKSMATRAMPSGAITPFVSIYRKIAPFPLFGSRASQSEHGSAHWKRHRSSWTSFCCAKPIKACWVHDRCSTRCRRRGMKCWSTCWRRESVDLGNSRFQVVFPSLCEQLILDVSLPWEKRSNCRGVLDKSITVSPHVVLGATAAQFSRTAVQLVQKLRSFTGVVQLAICVNGINSDVA
jgi:hypothetical protein